MGTMLAVSRVSVPRRIRFTAPPAASTAPHSSASCHPASPPRVEEGGEAGGKGGLLTGWVAEGEGWSGKNRRILWTAFGPILRLSAEVYKKNVKKGKNNLRDR